MQEYQLIATAASGIEALVGKELRNLGYDTRVENGRVRYIGTIKDVLNTNIWLRTADRVKIIVGEFEAKTFEELLIELKLYLGKTYYLLMPNSQ